MQKVPLKLEMYCQCAKVQAKVKNLEAKQATKCGKHWD